MQYNGMLMYTPTCVIRVDEPLPDLDARDRAAGAGSQSSVASLRKEEAEPGPHPGGGPRRHDRLLGAADVPADGAGRA